MMQNVKLKILTASISLVVIVGSFYVFQLREELAAARQQSLIAREETQKWSAKAAEAQASLVAAAEKERDLREQISRTASHTQESPDQLAQENMQLKRQVSALRNDMKYQSQVSEWWRELFDYTKPFAGAGGLRTADNVKS